jgi:ribA/ribD-fused uncharacterized protein
MMASCYLPTILGQQMAGETIYFFHLEEPYGCLSNFSRHQIYVDGTYWPTVEHYYQASKFEDPEHRRLVRDAETPTLAKRRGKSRKRPIRRDWNDIKIDVMRKSLRAKSLQHADVRAVLLATQSARIIQRTDADRFWGDGKKREGRNMLGKLWMQTRDRLIEPGGFDELARPLPPPWEKQPDIPLGSIGWRMGFGEAYLDEWYAFFGGLTPAGRRRYREIYPVPDSWLGFYEG